MMSMKQTLRIGVDIGGTFTDFYVFCQNRMFSFKVLTTPSSPAKALVNGIKRIISDIKDIPTLELSHATTLSTNIFLGQLKLNLPKTALITTEGFEDVIEIGRQIRPELYNLFFRKIKPLIPKHLRYGIKERVDFRGYILKKPSFSNLKKIVEKLRKEKIESLAICFLHSYLNPQNEILVKEYIARFFENLYIDISYDVNPFYREYERTSTTVINSILKPLMSKYLDAITYDLNSLNIPYSFYIMQSSGGLGTFELAKKYPITTIESGPVTGVCAAAALARKKRISRVLSFDMGGTTAKVSMIVNYKPSIVDEYEISTFKSIGKSIKGTGYPVRIPIIDIVEVSAGGGTIAEYKTGMIKVGPLSAGASPGPACYNCGGDLPTVTDANILLGRLLPENFQDIGKKLNISLAYKAVERYIAQKAGIGVYSAAAGIIKIVNAQMMRALRLMTVERGYNPSEFTLFAFGGAGPMHAGFLAKMLNIKKVIVPYNAGVFSALGLLLLDFQHVLTVDFKVKVEDINDRILEKRFSNLIVKLKKILSDNGVIDKKEENLFLQKDLLVRYVGQSYLLNVLYYGNIEKAIKDFERKHKKVYGFRFKGEKIEIAGLRLLGKVLRSHPDIFKSKRQFSLNISGQRKVYFEETGFINVPVYSDSDLEIRKELYGPAIIAKVDSTVIVPPLFKFKVDRFKNIIMERI